MSSPGPPPVRQLVLLDLLSLMLATGPGRRALVAVDGPDGVGKTRMVEELVAIAAHVAGREVLSVSVDDFHHPRALRWAMGRDARTHYEDAFDYAALRARVLRPFRDGGPVVRASWDLAADRPADPEPVHPSEDALLLVEGVYLRRPELVGEWDATCLVTAPARVTVPRGNARFPGRRVPGDDDPAHPVNARYTGAQALYRQQARTAPPSWIVDNTDLRRPEIVVPDPDEPQWFEQG
ncbi:MAG TPA: uridine kinase [Ornithinimicrobium sp.]|nr:uridine kinase [Ornithinimicrobium sp.]